MFKKIDEKVKLLVGFSGNLKKDTLCTLLQPNEEHSGYGIGELEELRGRVNDLEKLNGRLLAMLLVKNSFTLQDCADVLETKFEEVKEANATVKINGKKAFGFILPGVSEEEIQGYIMSSTKTREALKGRNVTFIDWTVRTKTQHVFNIVTE